MPQPHRSAPLAPRPDPGAQLLEAVQERHAQRSLQLAQQWVHRRGVLDLQRFCSTRLDGAQGPDAVAWLQNLLALETPIPASNGTPASGAQAAASRVPVQLDAAAMATTSLRETSAVAWEDPAPPAGQSQQDLQARAVAAVDEAFAALAQSFEEETPSLAAAPLPLATEPVSEPPPARIGVPQPVPLRSGLWPSLWASAASFGSALRPLRQSSQAQLAEQPQERQVSHGPAPAPEVHGTQDDAMGGPSGLEAAASAADAQAQETSTLPNPTDQLVSSGETEAEGTLQLLDSAQVSGDAAESAAAAPADAMPPAQGGLLRRLRGRIQPGGLPRLKRLRAVMQDCVEETVALLRTPEPERQEEDGGFDVNQPPEPAWAAHEQHRVSWTLDPFLPPAPLPVASSEPQPETPAIQSPAPAPAPSRLRFGLPTGKPGDGGGSDRPAPAPDALSDLRAWLPDRSDLPRAS